MRSLKSDILILGLFRRKEIRVQIADICRNEFQRSLLSCWHRMRNGRICLAKEYMISLHAYPDDCMEHECRLQNYAEYVRNCANSREHS